VAASGQSGGAATSAAEDPAADDPAAEDAAALEDAGPVLADVGVVADGGVVADDVDAVPADNAVPAVAGCPSSEEPEQAVSSASAVAASTAPIRRGTGRSGTEGWTCGTTAMGSPLGEGGQDASSQGRTTARSARDVGYAS